MRTDAPALLPEEFSKRNFQTVTNPDSSKPNPILRENGSLNKLTVQMGDQTNGRSDVKPFQICAFSLIR